MAAPELTRAYESSVHVSDDEGRIVVGTAAPYGTPVEVRDQHGHYTEIIAPGAFTRTLREHKPEEIRVCLEHDKARVIGRAVRLWEDKNGLHCELKISRTRDGDEALELIKDKAISGLSFRGRIHKFVKKAAAAGAKLGTITRQELGLTEISLTSWPIYPTAAIHAIRARHVPAQERWRFEVEARERTLQLQAIETERVLELMGVTR